MHIISLNSLGIPQKSRDAFDILFQNDIIDKTFAERLKAMVGFRNIAVHDYKTLNLEIVKSIIEFHLDDFLDFTKLIIKKF